MSNGSILVVDDIRKNIQVLGSALSKQGYEVSYATTGSKALEMVSNDRFDLILLDIMMPEMDGFEVCRRLKSAPDSQDVPILFLTAKSEPSDIIKGLEQGAVDYLTKPFNTAELIARVNTHVSFKQARDLISLKNAELEEKNRALQELLDANQKAKEEIKTLEGILPICSSCKKIRDDKGYWNRIEAYIEKHSDAYFSHSMCQECADKFYSHEDWYVKMKKKKQSG